MTFRSLLATSLLLTSVFPAGASKIGDRRRPFFIIGHMANTLGEVDAFLKDGANAVEVDIEFADNGTVLGTYHEMFPCECFRVCGKREKIKTFLSHIREITGALSKDYRMNVLLSIGYVEDKDVLRGAIKYLKQKEYSPLLRKVGYDVGMNGDLKSIKRMYKKLGIRRHRWQGDGLMNCFRFLLPTERLIEAIKQRDRPGGSIDKVYYWTVDLPAYIADAIKIGIDGIITNRPDNAFYVVVHEFANQLRVAGAGDNPWKKFRRHLKEATNEVDANTDILEEQYIKELLPE
ncbi:dermonecrotic toxin SPH-like isoform X3 [Dermacentor andersoni]|uniref:dermonecrotic toxin SPH-like isoform X3 n=1 Tax=Dermacentor andersoni TaxID=34620 RepID=UPI002417107C|nr:dermonecrotic toxin SPH-like isoform X3 [Dermacentor andersoni]